MRAQSLLLAVALAVSVPAGRPAAASAAQPTPSLTKAPAEDLAYRAYVWGRPLIETALIRKRFTQGQVAVDPGTPINAFKHRRRLSGPGRTTIRSIHRHGLI